MEIWGWGGGGHIGMQVRVSDGGLGVGRWERGVLEEPPWGACDGKLDGCFLNGLPSTAHGLTT